MHLHIPLQILMVFLANLGCMSNGLGLGVPAVTLEALTNKELSVHLTKDQGSWYGKFPVATQIVNYI